MPQWMKNFWARAFWTALFLTTLIVVWWYRPDMIIWAVDKNLEMAQGVAAKFARTLPDSWGSGIFDQLFKLVGAIISTLKAALKMMPESAALRLESTIRIFTDGFLIMLELKALRLLAVFAFTFIWMFEKAFHYTGVGYTALRRKRS